MDTRTRALILIYNADGGLFSAVRDMVHKLLWPATYPCSLCALTYGPVMMRSAWRQFLAKSGRPILFLYRDEFQADLDARELPLPAILLGDNAGPPAVLVSAGELDALPDLPALIALVEARLASIGT